jgi:hypothetical protein
MAAGDGVAGDGGVSVSNVRMRVDVVDRGRDVKLFGHSCALESNLTSAAKQAAEKLNIRRPAPKGAIAFEGLAVSLKRYPDTKPEFFRRL